MAEEPLTPAAEAALSRALRDVADGHLSVWRSGKGVDTPDRGLAGAPKIWWEVLAGRGLYEPPVIAPGPWTLVR